jgi:hypothetical protein
MNAAFLSNENNLFVIGKAGTCNEAQLGTYGLMSEAHPRETKRQIVCCAFPDSL